MTTETNGKLAQDAIIQVEDLKIYYPTDEGVVRAVDGVDFELKTGETLGVVGESGCGKTTLGRTVVGLQPATSGDLVFEGNSLPGMAREREPDLRRRVQIIFQNPDATLNPQKSVGETIRRPLELFDLIPSPEQEKRVADLLKSVNLPPSYAQRYPHELSGGEKQRVAIARGLVNRPPVILADEPTAPLDSERAMAVIRILNKMARTFETAIIVVTHDEKIIPTFKRIYHIRDGVTHEEAGEGLSFK